MSSRMFLTLVLGAVAAAVIAGLLLVGSPAQGRRDRFDALRYAELNRIAQALVCDGPMRGAERPGPQPLPEVLTADTLAAHCPGFMPEEAVLTDDETGAAYRYERLGDTRFTLCAAFHDTGRLARAGIYDGSQWRLDRESGCITGQTAP